VLEVLFRVNEGLDWRPCRQESAATYAGLICVWNPGQSEHDSGTKPNRIPGDSEHHSELKANSIPAGSRTVFGRSRNGVRLEPE
jgi:hypothetical protein